MLSLPAYVVLHKKRFSAIALIVCLAIGVATPVLAEPEPGSEVWTISTPWHCLSANHRCIKYDAEVNQLGEPMTGCGSMSGYYNQGDVASGCSL